MDVNVSDKLAIADLLSGIVLKKKRDYNAMCILWTRGCNSFIVFLGSLYQMSLIEVSLWEMYIYANCVNIALKIKIFL